MAGDEVEMKLLLDHGEEERGFQHGECGADADSEPPAEWEIGEARNFAGADGVFAPPLGIEFIRIGEKAGVALRQRLKDKDVGAGSHPIAADLAVRYRFARKYRDQSGAVKTNEAYKALQHEIANAEGEMAKAEDRQLEIMMAGEDVERRVKNAEINLKSAEQSVAIERKDIETQQGAKKKELDAALAERERALAPIPEDLRILYDRIAKRHNGTALAQAKDGQCLGCGLRVLPHILQLLTHDVDDTEVYRCESCGLILYSLEPLAAVDPEAAAGNTAAATTS